MQTQRMVALTRQDGGTLVAVIMAIPLMFLAVYAVNTQLQNKIHEMRILRVQTRMTVLGEQVANSGSSPSSLYQSAFKAGTSSPLYKCVVQNNCKANLGSPESYELYNSQGQVVSGFHSLGEDLGSKAGAKTMRVKTTYEISCSSGKPTCTTPAEILTEYLIEQYDTNALKGRVLKPLSGQASLSRFACDTAEYISGVDGAGRPICTTAQQFADGFQCPLGGSFMVTADGQLVCEPIVNYCTSKIAFALVIDRSGSMKKDSKMSGAKSAAKEFIDDIDAGDQTGIVSFANDSKIVNTPSTDKSLIKRALNSITPRGDTNITAGLTKAESILKNAPRNMPRLIILLSDGQHNTGPSPKRKAEQLKRDGYRIWTIGYGSKADRAMLRRLATTPADYLFAASSKTLDDRFKELRKALCR